MPITPLHLGPGLLFKSVGGHHVSFTLFALSQVTMDLEVIARLLLQSRHLHGYSNTLMGATLLLLPTVLFGKPLCQWILRWWNRNLTQHQARWLATDPFIATTAAWTGGALGVYSHWLLDAIMHADARPWAPFSNANPFLGMFSIEQLNLLCLALLPMGLILYPTLKLLRRKRNPDSKLTSVDS